MARTETLKKARTPKTCDRTSWHLGCGRPIAAGEIYLSYYRGGLAQMALCGDCCDRLGVSA